MSVLRITTCFPRVNTILDSYAAVLGGQARGYRNHVYRTLNYYAKLSGTDDVPDCVMIGAAFHDVGIWTDRTFDYIEPSLARARSYLSQLGLSDLEPEVVALIGHHHKLRAYTRAHAKHVESYRRADLIDVSLGAIRFGLPRSFVGLVKAAFPNAGFHPYLCRVALRHFVRRPWRPLPMLRW